MEKKGFVRLRQEAAPSWIYIQGGPISGEGAAGEESQMIKFPFAAVKGFSPHACFEERTFLVKSFLCVNMYVLLVGWISVYKAP